MRLPFTESFKSERNYGSDHSNEIAHYTLEAIYSAGKRISISSDRLTIHCGLDEGLLLIWDCEFENTIFSSTVIKFFAKQVKRKGIFWLRKNRLTFNLKEGLKEIDKITFAFTNEIIL